MRSLNREQARALDRCATEELGLPGLVLMENAGRNAAHVALDILENELHLVGPDAVVAVMCGPGNNGGDGYVVARHLANAGAQVVAYACSELDQLKGDAAVMARVADRMGLVQRAVSEPERAAAQETLAQAHLVVDALLGAGFTGVVRPPLDALLPMVNAVRDKGAKVLALDLPSGLDCDTGEPSPLTVAAHYTVTFAAPKQGFANPRALPYLGEVILADIGVPPWLLDQAV